MCDGECAVLCCDVCCDVLRYGADCASFLFSYAGQDTCHGIYSDLQYRCCCVCLPYSSVHTPNAVMHMIQQQQHRLGHIQLPGHSLVASTQHLESGEYA